MMNRMLLVISTIAASVLYLSPVQAQNPAYYGGQQNGASGSVTVWGGSPYGTGYSGTINYGYAYPLPPPPPPPYAGAYWYPTCNHWHPNAWRAPANHAYSNGYAHGYADSHYDDGHHYGKHKNPEHRHGHNRGHH